MFFYSLPWNCLLHCFFTVNSSVIAAGEHLAGGSFMEKEWKTFPYDSVVSLRGVVVRCSRVEPKVQGSSLTDFFTLFFLFFFPFFVLLFSINI